MNYRETPVAGTGWTRSNGVNISNPYNGMPVISFQEEQILEVNGTTFVKPLGQLTENFADPSKQFDLVNPADGMVIGTASYMEIYLILYSLYLKLTTERDNQPV
jgi:hypothetical protein